MEVGDRLDVWESWEGVSLDGDATQTTSSFCGPALAPASDPKSLFVDILFATSPRIKAMLLHLSSREACRKAGR